MNNIEAGTGVYADTFGRKYSIEFEACLREGGGRLEYADSTYYDGTWCDDIKSGYGVQAYIDDSGSYYGIYGGS